MKRTEIVGENYSGSWKNERTACRAIIVKDGKMLLSYETVTDQWMIPGGGLEPGETEKDCCIRETAEETGLRVMPSECLLEIDEYYGSWKFISKYFLCEVIGEAPRHLTQREIDAGMEPRWLDVENAKAVFADHASYAETDEMRRGLYFREYTALCELEDHYKAL